MDADGTEASADGNSAGGEGNTRGRMELDVRHGGKERRTQARTGGCKDKKKEQERRGRLQRGKCPEGLKKLVREGDE